MLDKIVKMQTRG